MQSFAPLFLILFVKYFDCELCRLFISFFKMLFRTPIVALSRAVQHSLFITMLLEIFCLLWVIYSTYGIKSFNASQRANFTSQGESLVNIVKISDSGVTFFMTYVLPMAMDDLNSCKGISDNGIQSSVMICVDCSFHFLRCFFAPPLWHLVGQFSIHCS